MKLRALVVDDDRHARAKLCRLLADDAQIELVGECADGASALAAARQLGPDLVLLDVQMPGLDGFDVARGLGADWPGAIVFVTAHDACAVRALEIAAVDYVLKPVARARLDAAIERARRRLGAAGCGPELGPKLEVLLRHAGRLGGPERLLVRSKGQGSFLRVDAIEWAEAEDNYVRLHAGSASYLLRETLSRLEARLDPRRFVRIHRSFLIRLDAVAEVRPAARGDYEVATKGGAILPVSRTFREQLISAVEGE